jgi:hypothetical protein
MQPPGFTGMHHTPKPPIRIHNEMFAAPILTASGTRRTTGNDGSIFQPP